MKKPIKIWYVLIALPILLLLISAVLEVIVQFSFNKVTSSSVDSSSNSALCPGASSVITDKNTSCAETSDNSKGSKIAIRLLQVLLGFGAVISFMLEPLWIILLVQAHKHNKTLPTTTPTPST